MLDVLIVGAGPTGLLAAIECARFGLTCRIIDQSRAPSDKSKALAIQARTLEMLDHLGLVEPFLQRGIAIRRGNLLAQNELLARLDFGRLSSPYPFILSLPQSTTEALLSSHAATLGNQVERGVQFLSLTQNSQTVRAVVQHGNEQEVIESRWLIGCDGAHSAVRKSLGLTFQGEALPTVFSLADVTLDIPFPHDEVVSFLDRKGVLIAIPLPEQKRYRLIFELQRCQHEKESPPPTLSELEEIVATAMGPQARVSHPTWTANFHVHSRLAERFQEGRVFLAGDSAHIHSPAGGQGMNGGLQDIDNLIWKLAFVQQNKATEEILNTYTLERRFVAKNVLEGTKHLTQLATLQNRFACWLRKKLLPPLIRLPWVERLLVKTVSQTNLHYPQNRLILGPKAGRRAPNIPVGETDLYSLCRNTTEHTLLLFSGAEAQEIAKKFEGYARPIFIPQENKCSTLYLIRPDMVIGAVTESYDLTPLETYFTALSSDKSHRDR